MSWHGFSKPRAATGVTSPQYPCIVLRTALPGDLGKIKLCGAFILLFQLLPHELKRTHFFLYSFAISPQIFSLVKQHQACCSLSAPLMSTREVLIKAAKHKWQISLCLAPAPEKNRDDKKKTKQKSRVGTSHRVLLCPLTLCATCFWYYTVVPKWVSGRKHRQVPARAEKAVTPLTCEPSYN